MRRLCLQAALDAPLPAGCTRTVYLCDDGKNKQKRKWCLGRAPEVVYVSGRQRPKGEMNGKSANLNNCLRQIYPDNVPVPANEVVCIFDADQVCSSHASSLPCMKDTLGFLQQVEYDCAGSFAIQALGPPFAGRCHLSGGYQRQVQGAFVLQ